MEESKEIQAIKMVREKERDAWRQAIFCKKHNMKLLSIAIIIVEMLYFRKAARMPSIPS